MVQIQNFSENLEKSFARLGHEVQKNFETPEFQGIPEREVVKETIKSFAETAPVLPPEPQEEVPLPPPPPQSAPSVPRDDLLPSYMAHGENSEDVKNSVERLVQMVFDEDIEKAVMEAKRYPAFVEDAFHDALTDKVLPELKKRGIIK